VSSDGTKVIMEQVLAAFPADTWA